MQNGRVYIASTKLSQQRFLFSVETELKMKSDRDQLQATLAHENEHLTRQSAKQEILNGNSSPYKNSTPHQMFSQFFTILFLD